MTEKFTRWDVTEHLRTREDVRLYLEACADEDPGDGSLIRAALNDIARAKNMSLLAREIGMTREGLYKALSVNGNPTFTTVMRITRALGMQLRITQSTGIRDTVNGKPNIFDHATKELSHDAMICWLIKWSATPANDYSEQALRQLGREFLKAMLAKHGPELAGEVEKVELFQQDHGIDVLARVQDEGGKQHVLLIEDKTDTGEHGNQLRKYRDAISSGKTRLGEVPEYCPIYLKTGNQSLHKARELERDTGYRVFDRADFLAVLNRYQGADSIVMQYQARLQSLEDDFNGWKQWTPENRKGWSRAAWEGFYRTLEEGLHHNEEAMRAMRGTLSWRDVKPRGRPAFLGFFWYPFGDDAPTSFLQIEARPSDPSSQKLCFKVKPGDARMRPTEYYDILHEAAERTGDSVIARPYFRSGHKTMTVAHWEGDWFEFGEGGTPDIDKIVNNLLRAQRLLHSARNVVGRKTNDKKQGTKPQEKPKIGTWL